MKSRNSKFVAKLRNDRKVCLYRRLLTNLAIGVGLGGARCCSFLQYLHMLSRCLPTTTIRRYTSTLGPKAADSLWRQAIIHKNDYINAIVHLASEDASGALANGPLQKVAIAVKDNICTKSMPTTCSSAMLEGQNKSGFLFPSSNTKVLGRFQVPVRRNCCTAIEGGRRRLGWKN